MPVILSGFFDREMGKSLLPGKKQNQTGKVWREIWTY